MTRKIALLAVLITLCTIAVSADSQDAEGPRIECVVSAYPLIPDASMIAVSIPLLENVTLGAWYTASTFYFLPNPFFEAGVVAEYSFVKAESLDVTLGLGSALSMTSGTVSVPVILTPSVAYRPTSGFEFRFDVETLVYGGGGIAEPTLVLDWSPWTRGLSFLVGAVAAFGMTWDGTTAISYGYSAGLAYTFQ